MVTGLEPHNRFCMLLGFRTELAVLLNSKIHSNRLPALGSGKNNNHMKKQILKAETVECLSLDSSSATDLNMFISYFFIFLYVLYYTTVRSNSCIKWSNDLLIPD